MWLNMQPPAAACTELRYSSRSEGQACMEPDVRCIYRVYFRPEVMVLAGAKLLNRSLLMFREAPGRLACATRELMGLFFVCQLKWKVFRNVINKV